MAVDIIARLTCDMCGSTVEREVRRGAHSGKVETDLPSIVRDANGWELLGPSGHPVMDYRDGGKLLCSGCANRYRDVIKRHEREMRELFE